MDLTLRGCEAAHVVEAYFADYSCQKMLIDTQGYGVTVMDYGNYTLIVTEL
jgi:hypothetical protein